MKILQVLRCTSTLVDLQGRGGEVERGGEGKKETGEGEDEGAEGVVKGGEEAEAGIE